MRTEKECEELRERQRSEEGRKGALSVLGHEGGAERGGRLLSEFAGRVTAVTTEPGHLRLGGAPVLIRCQETGLPFVSFS